VWGTIETTGSWDRINTRIRGQTKIEEGARLSKIDKRWSRRQQ